MRNEYGDTFGGAVIVMGSNSMKENPNRLMTNIVYDGKRQYGVPQVGIAFRDGNSWKVDDKYSMFWNDFLMETQKPGFVEELLKESRKR